MEHLDNEDLETIQGATEIVERISEKYPWYFNEIDIEINKIFTSIYIGELFVAGMPKDDYGTFLQHLSSEEQIIFLELRRLAGKHFTELGISTAMATHLLLNKGTEAFVEGCRDEWAVYAHQKVTKRSYSGCLIFIVIIAALYWFWWK